jgi:hypothetical protein
LKEENKQTDGDSEQATSQQDSKKRWLHCPTLGVCVYDVPRGRSQ